MTYGALRSPNEKISVGRIRRIIYAVQGDCRVELSIHSTDETGSSFGTISRISVLSRSLDLQGYIQLRGQGFETPR